MKILVSIVTYNNADSIDTCIASVLESSITPDIFVVDNASIDETVEYVRNYPQIVIVELNTNRGYATANNIALDHAAKNGYDYVLILNPDTKVDPLMIEHLVQSAQQFHNLAIVGPVIYQEDGATIWSSGGFLDKKRYTSLLTTVEQTNQKNIPVEFVPGTALLIPAEVLRAGIRFFEPYFLYYEEIEFCLRAQKIGFSTYVIQGASLIHFENSSKISQLKNYYLARNHLLFVERNAPFRVQLREIFRLPKTVFEHLLSHNVSALVGIKDYVFRKFNSYTGAGFT